MTPYTTDTNVIIISHIVISDMIFPFKNAVNNPVINPTIKNKTKFNANVFLCRIASSSQARYSHCRKSNTAIPNMTHANHFGGGKSAPSSMTIVHPIKKMADSSIRNLSSFFSSKRKFIDPILRL